MISLFVQDWKTGDRVLAKWQDCKFYPAKITKCLNDGKKPVNVIWREVCGCQNRTKILALAPFNESKDSIVWTVLFQRCYKTKQTKKRGKLLAPNKSEKKSKKKDLKFGIGWLCSQTFKLQLYFYGKIALSFIESIRQRIFLGGKLLQVAYCLWRHRYTSLKPVSPVMAYNNSKHENTTIIDFLISYLHGTRFLSKADYKACFLINKRNYVLLFYCCLLI